MYDISQLNDLLVPELHDIAEKFSIPHMKKLGKPDLISAILEKQSNMNTENNATASSDAEKPKRKRIVKTDAAALPAAETNTQPATLTPEQATHQNLLQ